MFQTDAGVGSITVTENGNRPIRILIDRTQEFAMFLVIVLRHEKWTTSGIFHLRFVRRVPVLAKKCTAHMDNPRVKEMEDMDTTDEEDWRAMGAAALRGRAGSIIPPHWRQPTE